MNGIEVGSFVTNNIVIPLRSMGDGVMNIVAFIATLLTEDRKVFLIEELENDIHPQALKKLLELITTKSSKNQFIISTHSHIVLKYLGILPKSKIFYLEWSPFDVVRRTQVRVPTTQVREVENNPQSRMEILMKLGYEFHDFELFESYLLLEESSAESIIKDFLIPNIVPDLYNRIKTIAASGVDDLEVRVGDFSRLFVFIHTSPIYKGRAWIVADGDDAGKKVISNLKEKFRTWPSNHFLNFSKGNFEDYYPLRFQTKASSALKLKGLAKREAKLRLLHEIMDWSLKNRREAIEEFNKSAEEVILLLKKIEKSLKKLSI